MTVPGPAEIVGRSRFVVWILVSAAFATLAVTAINARAEARTLRAEMRTTADDRRATNRKLDDTVLALERSIEDNLRLQREVAELALASTPAEKRAILDRYERERLRAEARRLAEDRRRAEERRRADRPDSTANPSPDPTPRPSPTPSRTPRPTPSVTRTPTQTASPLLTCLPTPLPLLPPICA